MHEILRWSTLSEGGPVAFLIVVVVGFALSWVLHALLHALLRRVTEEASVARGIATRAQPLTRWLLPALVLRAALPLLDASPWWLAYAHHGIDLLIVLLLTWIAVRAVRGAERAFAARHPIDAPDNFEARRIQTQSRVLARSLQTLVWVVGAAIALMTLPGVRQLGASLLASAGVAGVVLGFAAKPVLGNLIAGVQLALTQPIRIDDVVVIEGEFGRIEEFASSFVTVRLWDERRMVVPLTWFIEHPFENWTRTTSQLLGSVTWWVDFSVSVDAIRDEVKRLVELDPRWDGRVASTAVVETSERAMQVRALMSARHSGDLWDLRCAVREGVIAFLRQRHPDALPRIRGELSVGPHDERDEAGGSVSRRGRAMRAS